MKIMGKLRVGIDIDEVLRSKWLQFDRFYVQEFGEKKIEKEPEYSYNFWKDYYWENTVEIEKELKEPEEMPENINPLHYQVDKNGESEADSFIFKPEVKIKLSAKEVYNRFIYQDFLFEIYGAAPKLYPQLDLDVNNFLEKYDNTVDFTIMSVENKFSIPPTLFFLSKISSRFKNYRFFKKSIDMWKNVDVLITTDPEIIKLGVPWGKKLIKLKRPYNVDLNSGTLEVLQIVDLINNKNFHKIIKFKNKK